MSLTNRFIAILFRSRITTMQALISLLIALQLVILSCAVTYFTFQQRQLLLSDLAQQRTTQSLEKLKDHLSEASLQSPTDMAVLLPHPMDGQLLLFEAQKHSNSGPLETSSSSWVQALQSSPVGQIHRLQLQGQFVYYQVQPWNDRTGKTWHMASVLRESDLQNVISKHDQVTLGIAGFGIVSSILLGLLSGYQLLRRVRRAFISLERQKCCSEERLQRLIINVPGVIYRAVRETTNGLDRFTYISPHCREIYEISSEEILTDDQALVRLIVPEDLRIMQTSSQQAIDTLSPWRIEYRIQTSSGKLKWLQLSASPELMTDGSIAWDGVILDITDRRRADTILNSYRVKLEATVKRRTAELEHANQELALMAQIDGLTQIANRRHFDQHLADDWKRLARSQQPLSLIMCDVDYFKRFNDHYGHPEGDMVLKKIAILLRQVAQRPDDLPARYGGEEFAIVLPNTDLIGAMQIAEELRQEVLALKIKHVRSTVNAFVTLSLGVASVTPNEINESVRSPEDLICIADHALYEAKHNGRNRCQVQDSRCLVKSKSQETKLKTQI